MKTKLPIQKKFIVTIALVLVLLPVLMFVGYRNREVISKLYHFQNSSMYSNDVVLFYDSNCSHCAKVDDFIRNNNVEKSISFIRLEALRDSVNANILEDKAQICGLNFQEIGVPFLWDGGNKKCVIGYVDIIRFFNQKITKK